jgi:hypothetical protein
MILTELWHSEQISLIGQRMEVRATMNGFPQAGQSTPVDGSLFLAFISLCCSCPDALVVSAILGALLER